MKVAGGCHCGAVRFAAEVAPDATLLDCICSICDKTGFLHLIVPHGNFTLLSGVEALASYRFGTGAAEHLFCRHCGIKSFYVPRSHPDGYSVNGRCLDAGTVSFFHITPFDDNDREAATAAVAHLTDG